MTDEGAEYAMPPRETPEYRPFGDLPKSGLIRPTTSPFDPAPEEELATLEGRIVPIEGVCIRQALMDDLIIDEVM